MYSEHGLTGAVQEYAEGGDLFQYVRYCSPPAIMRCLAGLAMDLAAPKLCTPQHSHDCTCTGLTVQVIVEL